MSKFKAKSDKAPQWKVNAMDHPYKFGAGAKLRRKLRNKSHKVEAVMSEFKRGTLMAGNKKKVINRKQAIAIAMSEAGISKRK